MHRRQFAGLLFGVCLAPVAWGQPLPSIPAEEIIEKNAASRGGVQAWQRLKTMAWTGYVESGTAQGRKLSFLLEQKRPNMTRFELVNDGQRSIRLFDGKSGWKLRPNSSNGHPELSPYSDDELIFARGAQVIDGPLMDYVARGASVTVGGHGQAEGRYAYILDVKLPSGGSHRIWVDAETFLEVRHDRQVRSGLGQLGTVSVIFREYREFEGVKIPTQIETGAGIGTSTNKLVIERVALNPEFEDRMFAKPDVSVSRKKSIIVDTRTAGTPAGPSPAGQQ